MKKTYIVKVAADGRVEREPFDADDSLGQLQRAVGGYIERVPIPMVRGRDLFVNEDGIAERLPQNWLLTLMARKRTQNSCYGIVGNGVYAAHDKDGETVGLTEAECDDIEYMLMHLSDTLTDKGFRRVAGGSYHATDTESKERESDGLNARRRMARSDCMKGGSK